MKPTAKDMWKVNRKKCCVQMCTFFIYVLDHGQNTQATHAFLLKITSLCCSMDWFKIHTSNDLSLMLWEKKFRASAMCINFSPLHQQLYPQPLQYLPDKSDTCPHLHLLLGSWKRSIMWPFFPPITDLEPRLHHFKLLVNRNSSLGNTYPASSGRRRSKRAACFWDISEACSEWVIIFFSL